VALYTVMIGPAGSGKSALTHVLSLYAEGRGATVVRVNFDPAVEILPYEPHVDVRDYVRAEDFMKQGLGPNGALIAAVGSLINYVGAVRERIEEYNPDLVIVDTPGQLELFAYRVSGPTILSELIRDDPATTVFLMDAPFFEDPLSIVSALSLSSSVAIRLRLPQVNVVSKADLLLPEIVEEVIPRLGEEGFLESLIESYPADANLRILALRIAEAVRDSGFIGEVIPVSIYNEESIAKLYAKILQIHRGGEEPGLEWLAEDEKSKRDSG